MILKNSQSDRVWKFAEYLLYVFYVVFPFITLKAFLYSGTSIRSAFLILVSIILGVVASVWLFKKKSMIALPKSYILLAIIVYFIFIGISAIVGLNFETSFWSTVARTTGIWYLLHLGFLLVLSAALFYDREKQRKLILCITVSTALYSLLSLLGPEGLGWIFAGYPNDGFTFGNSTFAGMYIFGAFLLSVYYIFQAEVRKWWMYIIPVLLIINPFILSKGVWFGSFSSGIVGEARTSSYALGLSIIALCVLWLISKIKDARTKKLTSYALFGISIVVIACAAYSLLSEGGYVQKIYLSQATAARPLVWETSRKVIAERPYFGWGVDNFERVFELNYDNRILQDEYGNEPWFDRAHNIFIDEAIDNGSIGLTVYIIVYLVLIGSLIYVALNSKNKQDRILSSFLIVYFAFHFFELQTAFDTSISYPILIFMISSAIILFHRTISQSSRTVEYQIPATGKYVIAGIILIFCGWSFFVGWVPFVRAQLTNGKVRTVGDSVKRLPMYNVLLNSPVDKHAFLWRTSTDFQRGISENPDVLKDPVKRENLKKELGVFENLYRDFVKDNPHHFRAKLNFADILIYERLFGVNKLNEAQMVLNQAIEQVPQSPQPYWMKAVAYIYMKKFDEAREYAQKALALNPQIKESQALVQYVEKSIKEFPSVNLYFFRQI